MRVSRLLAWLLPFVLLCTLLVQPAHAFSWPWEKEESAPVAEETVHDLKLYTRLEPVGGRLKGAAHPLAKNLYDGDESTLFTHSAVQEVTLDLGRLHMLGGVQFLPCEGEKETDIDRCIGTAFFVSRDNRNFQKAAVAEPIDNLSYTPEWKELMFGGAGQFRYVKIVIPAGARISEVKWLAYPDWTYTGRVGKQQWNLRLCAYEAQRPIEGRIIAAAFNPQGVMKAMTVVEKTFLPDEDCMVDLHLAIGQRQIGDSYRVMAWDKNGTSLLARDLQFFDTDATPSFSMSNLFSDAMMFQADKPLTVWGTAPAQSRVAVALTKHQGESWIEETVADASGEWEAEMGSFPAGGSYSMTVQCGGETKAFEDITFGDIWLCMGQSNMDYHLLGGEDTVSYLKSRQGKKETNNPNIRLVNLWTKGTGGAGSAVSNLPIGYVHPAWSVMNHEAASYCSAIGYFFAQQIQKEYEIPVGILNVAVGDTEINRWLPYGEQFGSFSGSDGGLYYNRILPLAKLQIRGILMYQGEADEYRTHLSTEEYRDALSGLVDLYRGIWGEDLPFYWTQLTRYKSDESLIRQGQRLALSQISNPKNAGVVSLMDIYGEYKSGAGNCREDIHPHQKKEVADRFLRYAKRDVYGETEIAAVGPTYQSMRRVGNALKLSFACNGGLAVLPPERYADAKGMQWILDNKMDSTKPQEFEIAGVDGIFYRAEAEIQGNCVILKSEQVLHPVRARYAWGTYPEMPNLTDASGLAALAFCTDALE
jgi:sialate O-acetylesterase